MRRTAVGGRWLGLMLMVTVAAAAAGGAAGVTAAQDPPPVHAPLDRLLDLYARDGFVYYRALKSDRSRFDRYIDSLNVAPATYDKWSHEQKVAFWINAYNAFVLETIINNYPIRGHAAEYPANSVRQIPGAFEKLPHRAAGRTVTLDEIDKTVIAELKEPRALLALGRGAIGGGRLHSEAYTAVRLDEQLKQVAAECVTRKECVTIDATQGTLSVTPIFGWREAQFVEGLGQGGESTWPGRSAVERAVLTLIQPHVLPGEREFLKKNEFKVTYHKFDWRLNDLTGGMPER
jgi:Protein of unknown function, DUF547